MIRIAIVGGGKIARDQHMPTIAASDQFVFAAAVTLPDAPLPGVPNFPTINTMKAALPVVTAVALCTPPSARHALMQEALAAGLDILNEKPPAATLAQGQACAARAQAEGRVFYQAWHSREAAAVEPAMAWLAGKSIRAMTVTWKEDVRVWHPGQEWIWTSGIGVFDPGINAISVVTRLLPQRLQLQAAEMRFPANKPAPIAADLAWRGGSADLRMAFDFDQKGPQSWDIDIETDGGKLKLSRGASCMAVDGREVPVGDVPEYARVYRRFATLLESRRSDADFTPFEYVSEVFARGRRLTVAPFSWEPPPAD